MWMVNNYLQTDTTCVHLKVLFWNSGGVSAGGIKYLPARCGDHQSWVEDRTGRAPIKSKSRIRRLEVLFVEESGQMLNGQNLGDFCWIFKTTINIMDVKIADKIPNNHFQLSYSYLTNFCVAVIWSEHFVHSRKTQSHRGELRCVPILLVSHGDKWRSSYLLLHNRTLHITSAFTLSHFHELISAYWCYRWQSTIQQFAVLHTQVCTHWRWSTGP